MREKAQAREKTKKKENNTEKKEIYTSHKI